MNNSVLTSTVGYLSLLHDSEHDSLKEHALNQLNQLIDCFWPEVADHLPLIEQLYERDDFASRKLAALIASKVYYYLGAFSDSMYYALKAESSFNINEKSEYVETIVAKFIDEYIRIRLQDDDKNAEMDASLETIVNRMLDSCLQDGDCKKVIGIALQSKRLDLLERVLLQNNCDEDLFKYIFCVSMDFVPAAFSMEVLKLLVKLHRKLERTDWMSVGRCLLYLEDAQQIAAILNELMVSGTVGGVADVCNDSNVLYAYQMAFELSENCTQNFLKQIVNWLDILKASSKPVVQLEDSTGAVTDAAAIGGEDRSAVTCNSAEEARNRLMYILSGEASISVYLQFLYRSNNSDLNILKNIKSSFEPRNSVLHTATVVANSYMNAGTTKDLFLRENLDWLKRATNWAKFSATASLGVIHKGHIRGSMTVLEPYLPKGVGRSSNSIYMEGGSLFALGMINAGCSCDENVTKFLLEQLQSESEVVVHGAALGLGLVEMVSFDERVFNSLLQVLYTRDDTSAGEAAGYALGMVMFGSANPQCESLLDLAHETQHEKIVRGISIGLALMYCGLEERADLMIEQMLRDKNSTIRYGATFMIGLAYVGTGRSMPIKKLLHIAVSDVSDNVRRAAVLNLGLIMFHKPDQVPKIVSLLAESYNSAVRYGACMAIGIACAGTGQKESVDLLWNMAKTDPVDTVKQGALISLALVLVQSNDSRATEFSKYLKEKIEDKHDSTMSKYGAILASGIIDAGGRNVTISMMSNTGHMSKKSLIGLVLFAQYWYWFPMTHFLVLSFIPTCIIGLNRKLKIPKWEFKSNAPPFMFSYPDEVKIKSKSRAVQFPKVELAAVKRGRNKKKLFHRSPPEKKIFNKVIEKKIMHFIKNNKSFDESLIDSVVSDAESREDESMPLEMVSLSSPPPNAGQQNVTKPVVLSSAASDQEVVATSNEKVIEEATFEIYSNPHRVLRSQLKYISYTPGRYKPIYGSSYGIVVLKDLTPDKPEKVLKFSLSSNNEPQENEIQPPEPFEFMG